MKTLLNRHGNILDFALSSLLRRKTKNLSLLVVYTLIVFIIASLIFFVQAMRREARADSEAARLGWPVRGSPTLHSCAPRPQPPFLR